MKRIFVLVFLLIAFVAANESTISKKEMYDRARDVLKESLEEKNMTEARKALEYLHANIENGAPLTAFEEYLAHLELGDYEEAIGLYVNARRLSMDSTYKPEPDHRINQQDALSLYLYRDLAPFDKSKADSLIAIIDASSIPQKTKDLYASLIYNEITVSSEAYLRGNTKIVFYQIFDTTAIEAFLNRTESYIAQAPDESDTRFLKEDVYPFVKKIIDQHRDFRKNPLKHKYYSGGLGFYYSRWFGAIKGEASQDIKMDMGTFMLELELQFSRFNLGFLIAYGIDGEFKDKNEFQHTYDDSDGSYDVDITAGIDAFDSRFLKVVPFMGIGGRTVSTLGIDSKTHFLLGTNVDLRLLSTTPSRLGGAAIALHLRLKYSILFSSYSDSYRIETNPDAQYYEDRFETRKLGGDYINHIFSIGLGLFLW